MVAHVEPRRKGSLSDSVVRVWREGQSICVSPPCLDELAGVLQSAALGAEVTPEGTIQVGRRTQPLDSLEKRGYEAVLRAPAGLIPVVLGALRSSGAEIRHGGLVHPPLELPSDLQWMPDVHLI